LFFHDLVAGETLGLNLSLLLSSFDVYCTFVKLSLVDLLVFGWCFHAWRHGSGR